MSDSVASPSRRRVAIEVEPGAENRPSLFAASLGSERTVLEPGRTWIHVDHFKWAIRGIVETPQSFAVHPDGSVDLNGETYRPETPGAAEALQEALNKKHVRTAPAPARGEASPARETHRETAPSFRVHLDHLSHILVQAFRGTERTETGLRGLAHLAADGWMRPPKTLHVDPLQRYVELDGVRFDNNAEGAHRLEAFLNAHFVPQESGAAGHAIEVRENSAASTGFDIRFTTLRAGVRVEVKGHLSQDKLDLLQEHEKCDLLQPGILLRISPPYLYLRRRRHDGTEEHVPGLPDIKYRSVSAAELERILNHPAIRNPATLAASERPTADPVPASPAPIDGAKASIPAPAPPSPPERPASFTPPPKSPPPRLTPPSPAETRPNPPDAPPLPGNGGTPVPGDENFPPPFDAQDAHRTHEAAFRELARRLHVPVQDVLLSLPRVFDDRRFEILDFNGEEIVSVLQLRTDHFYGFYLTHIGPEVIDLVYACHGLHLEWGTHKCTIQPGLGSETLEFRGSALLGIAQNAEHHFVFVVRPPYREWVRHHERICAEAYARFVTPDEWQRQSEAYPRIWPPPA